jgi:uncharacterized protein YggE
MKTEKAMRTLAIASILLVVSSLPVRGQQPQPYDDRPKISVTGEAVVYVKPDKIIVTFGIQTLDKDIQQAKTLNNDVLKKAVAAIKECGVPEKEIQTDCLSIEPRYDDRYGAPQHFLGYFVQNTFTVTLGDAAKVDKLVTNVLAAGVTNIHGIDFQTTEFKKYREQARELALKVAKEKAEKMAAVLGQSIGAPLQISENYFGMPGGWGSNRTNGMSQNTAQDMRGVSGDVSDTIALGKLAIRAGVSVTFELKK